MTHTAKKHIGRRFKISDLTYEIIEVQDDGTKDPRAVLTDGDGWISTFPIRWLPTIFPNELERKPAPARVRRTRTNAVTTWTSA